MSIVGPRPHLLEHNAEFAKIMAGYHVRAFVKPGITGSWLRCAVFAAKRKIIPTFKIESRAISYFGELEPFAGDRNYPEDGCATVPAAADRLLRFFLEGRALSRP